MAAPIEAPWLLGTMWMGVPSERPMQERQTAPSMTLGTPAIFSTRLPSMAMACSLSSSSPAKWPRMPKLAAPIICAARVKTSWPKAQRTSFVRRHIKAEDVADRLFTGEEFIHAARRKTRNVVTIQIIHQNNAEELV